MPQPTPFRAPVGPGGRQRSAKYVKRRLSETTKVKPEIWSGHFVFLGGPVLGGLAEGMEAVNGHFPAQAVYDMSRARSMRV